MIPKSEYLIKRAIEMRSKPTYHEKLFMDKLDAAAINYEFQKVIGNYIVDFCIKNIVVEIDGESHDTREIYDADRTIFIKQQGYRLFRIRNEDVKNMSVSSFVSRYVKKEKKKKSVFNDLKKISSSDAIFKKLGWNKQKVILQRERIYGKH